MNFLGGSSLYDPNYDISRRKGQTQQGRFHTYAVDSAAYYRHQKIHYPYCQAQDFVPEAGDLMFACTNAGKVLVESDLKTTAFINDDVMGNGTNVTTVLGRPVSFATCNACSLKKDDKGYRCLGVVVASAPLETERRTGIMLYQVLANGVTSLRNGSDKVYVGDKLYLKCDSTDKYEVNRSVGDYGTAMPLKKPNHHVEVTTEKTDHFLGIAYSNADAHKLIKYVWICPYIIDSGTNSLTAIDPSAADPRGNAKEKKVPPPPADQINAMIQAMRDHRVQISTQIISMLPTVEDQKGVQFELIGSSFPVYHIIETLMDDLCERYVEFVKNNKDKAQTAMKIYSSVVNDILAYMSYFKKVGWIKGNDDKIWVLRMISCTVQNVFVFSYRLVGQLVDGSRANWPLAEIKTNDKYVKDYVDCVKCEKAITGAFFMASLRYFVAEPSGSVDSGVLSDLFLYPNGKTYLELRNSHMRQLEVLAGSESATKSLLGDEKDRKPNSFSGYETPDVYANKIMNHENTLEFLLRNPSLCSPRNVFEYQGRIYYTARVCVAMWFFLASPSDLVYDGMDKDIVKIINALVECTRYPPSSFTMGESDNSCPEELKKIIDRVISVEKTVSHRNFSDVYFAMSRAFPKERALAPPKTVPDEMDKEEEEKKPKPDDSAGIKEAKSNAASLIRGTTENFKGLIDAIIKNLKKGRTETRTFVEEKGKAAIAAYKKFRLTSDVVRSYMDQIEEKALDHVNKSEDSTTKIGTMSTIYDTVIDEIHGYFRLAYNMFDSYEANGYNHIVRMIDCVISNVLVLTYWNIEDMLRYHDPRFPEYTLPGTGNLSGYYKDTKVDSLKTGMFFAFSVLHVSTYAPQSYTPLELPKKIEDCYVEPVSSPQMETELKMKEPGYKNEIVDKLTAGEKPLLSKEETTLDFSGEIPQNLIGTCNAGWFSNNTFWNSKPDIQPFGLQRLHQVYVDLGLAMYLLRDTALLKSCTEDVNRLLAKMIEFLRKPFQAHREIDLTSSPKIVKDTFESAANAVGIPGDLMDYARTILSEAFAPLEDASGDDIDFILGQLDQERKENPPEDLDDYLNSLVEDESPPRASSSSGSRRNKKRSPTPPPAGARSTRARTRSRVVDAEDSD